MSEPIYAREALIVLDERHECIDNLFVRILGLPSTPE
jgi:hypothetical protein